MGDNAAREGAGGGSRLLVFQANGSLPDWLEGDQSVVVLCGLGGVAWTYPSNFTSLISCVVNGFLALGSMRSGGLDAWKPGLGAEMAHLFGTGVCTVRRTGAFSFYTWESLFQSLVVRITSKCFFPFYCSVPSVKKLFKFTLSSTLRF